MVCVCVSVRVCVCVRACVGMGTHHMRVNAGEFKCPIVFAGWQNDVRLMVAQVFAEAVTQQQNQHGMSKLVRGANKRSLPCTLLPFALC